MAFDWEAERERVERNAELGRQWRASFYRRLCYRKREILDHKARAIYDGLMDKVMPPRRK
jgi:hypothetical protein